jgi:hypothetical protein
VTGAGKSDEIWMISADRRGTEIGGGAFVSFASVDRDYAIAPARRLRNIGISVWIDQDITAGANWD